MKNFIKHFVREGDGSWTCREHATLEGPQGRIQVTPGARFTPGTEFMGIDLAKWLDEQAAQDAAKKP
jgi:hypothetical protein